MRNSIHKTLTIATFYLFADLLHSSEFLDSSTYLQQVTQNNQDILASDKLQYSYLDQAEEGALLFSPKFVSKALAGFTQQPQLLPGFPLFLNHATLIGEEYKVEFNQNTNFGLDWSLGVESHLFQLKSSGSQPFAVQFPFNLINSAFPGGIQSEAAAQITPSSVISSTPTWSTVQGVSFKQHLWKNGFGARIRAEANHLKHKALSQSYQEGYKFQSSLVQAENIYWQYVIAKAVKELREEMVKESEQLLAFIEQRKNAFLVLESEVEKARSIYISYRVDYERAKEDVTAMALSFNSLRGISVDTVKEELSPISYEVVDARSPRKKGMRKDLLAKKEEIESELAKNRMAIEDLLPDFNISGFVGFQGNASNFPNSFSNSITNPAFSANIVISLSIPLSPFKISSLKSAYRSKAYSLDMNYKRACFEHYQEWDKLQIRLKEKKNLLALLIEQAEIEKEKFEAVRLDFERGLDVYDSVDSAQKNYLKAKILILQTFQNIIEIILNLSLYETD